MRDFEAIFYDKPDGSMPAREFIATLDPKMRAKISRLIDILEVNGTELREPYSKKLKDGIFELRAQVGNNITRILYFFFIGKRIILTNGFVKKTQETPDKEIDKAISYRKEYFERKEVR